MYIDSYVQDPRTAGISIFHDGLPKLASVHCYDRGNIATFGLQSCQPRPLKDPPQLYPIRPVVNHFNPKVPIGSQPRMYSGHPRPHLNQPKLYSGAFFPPGSQPRIQRMDGRPVLLPSTFNNTFIHKECFDPNVNKSNSVVYNGPYPHPSCCMQYASIDHCHPFPDDVVKQQPNIVPTTMSYTMRVDARRQRMEHGSGNIIRPPEYCDFSREAHHVSRKVVPDSFKGENRPMICNSGDPVITCMPGRSTMLHETGNTPLVYKSPNLGLSCKYTDVIDLVADEEFKEKCCINQKPHDTHSPNRSDTLQKMNTPVSSCVSNGYAMNTAKSPGCKSCQHDHGANNHQSLITSSSPHGIATSSPLRSDSAKYAQNTSPVNQQNIGYRSIENCPQNENISRVFPRTKSNVSIRSKRADLINQKTAPCDGIDNSGNPRDTFARNNRVASMTRTSSARTLTGGDKFDVLPLDSLALICTYCNSNVAENQLASPGTENASLDASQTKPVCLNCVRSWGSRVPQGIAGIISQNVLNGNRDLNEPVTVDESHYPKKESQTDRQPSEIHGNMGDNFMHAELSKGGVQIRSRSEETTPRIVANDTNLKDHQLDKKSASVPLMERFVVKTEPNMTISSNIVDKSNVNVLESNTNDDDSLDIDEKSFDTFINNTRSDTDSPSFHSNSLNNQKDGYASPINELSRKRKSPFLPLNMEINEDLGQLNDKNIKYNCESPNYHNDAEQFLRFRNKATPILKAKKWIRQNSLDSPTDESSCSFTSE